MTRKPATFEELASWLDRHVRLTNTRLLRLEKLVETNGLNGAGAILHRLEPLAVAADDLAAMAKDHAAQRELANAMAIVDASSALAAKRRQEHLESEWLYRSTVGIRKFLASTGDKLYYAILGGVGWVIASNTGAAFHKVGEVVVFAQHHLPGGP